MAEMAEIGMAEGKKKPPKRYRSELHRRQRTKNLALMAVLVAFVILVYLVAIVRMGGG